MTMKRVSTHSIRRILNPERSDMPDGVLAVMVACGNPGRAADQAPARSGPRDHRHRTWRHPVETTPRRRRAPPRTSEYVTTASTKRPVHRTVADNQQDKPVPIAVIQGASAASGRQSVPTVPLERKRDTGLMHKDGTLSLAAPEGPRKRPLLHLRRRSSGLDTRQRKPTARARRRSAA